MSAVRHACALGAVALAVVPLAFRDSGSSPVSGSRAVDGAELFHAKGCAVSHDGPNSTARVGGFPPLLDATNWAGQRRPELNAGAYLAESINEPNAFISPAFTGANGPATAMPNLTLAPDEVDAIIDYLLSS